MGRPPCCEKSNVKRGPWTAEEDAKILAYVASHGIGNWTFVPQKAGLNRCGKSCRLRWTNYLRPDLKHDNFTSQEEELILKIHEAIGSRWSLIAKQLPGRTDNDVKNYWNTKLKKKLTRMGVDPVTHKPFSKVIDDYGNISGLPNTRNQIMPLRNSINNRPMEKTESYLVTQELPNPSVVDRTVTDQIQENSFTKDLFWDNLHPFEVSKHETMQQQHLFIDVQSSTSSSSSCRATQLNSPQSFSCQPSQVQKTPSSPPSWSKFFLGDPFLDMVQEEDCNFQEIFPSYSPSSTQNENEKASILMHQDGSNRRDTRNSLEANSSAVDSFVEAILDQDSVMQSAFPALLSGNFDY